MEKVMILTTADEIAEGIKKILADHSATFQPKPSFEAEKMTVGQGANYIDVSYPTLCKWINEGKIRIHGKGRTRFLLRSELILDYKQLK